MKRNLVGIFALVLAIGFSSFTSKRALDKWFEYSGATNTAADVFVPTNYSDIGASDPGDPLNSTNLLAYIHVEVSSEVHPALTTYAGLPKVDVSSTIRTALQNNIVTPTTPVEIASRIYVR